MSVNYDKTIGVLVLPQQRPPTGISQHLPSPPTGSRWVPTGWRSKAFKNVGSITQAQENGGQDWVIQSRINAASQVFRSLKKSVFTSNHVDSNSKLHFYSCMVLSRLMYGAAEPWALTLSQVAQLETLHNSCMHRMMGRYRG